MLLMKNNFYLYFFAGTAANASVQHAKMDGEELVPCSSKEIENKPQDLQYCNEDEPEESEDREIAMYELTLQMIGEARGNSSKT